MQAAGEGLLANSGTWLKRLRPPSRDAVNRFLTALGHAVEDVFARLVEQTADGGLLDMTFRIDSIDIEALPWNDDASWNYDPTAEEFYYGFGCTVVTTGPKIPIAAEFTDAKRAKQETAMHVTCDALDAKQLIWMVGDGSLRPA